MATTSEKTAKPALNRMMTTAQAAHLILGGTDTIGYWGFTFDDFVTKLQSTMITHIGDPAVAPWRKYIDFTSVDYLDLQAVIDGMDFTPNPADRMDPVLAAAFVRRCDIIGMHGGVNGIGVGKDTVAAALKPHGFISMSFADTLKASLAMAYGVPMRYVTDRSLKEQPLPGTAFSPRRLMQLWGTEIGRSVDSNLWVKRHQLRVASAMHGLSNIAAQNPERISPMNGVRVTVPDVRFADEAAYVRGAGGFVAWISRPSIQETAVKLSNGHISEAGIPTFPTDVHLVNEGSIESFQAKAKEVLLERVTPSELATAARSTKTMRPS